MTFCPFTDFEHWKLKTQKIEAEIARIPCLRPEELYGDFRTLTVLVKPLIVFDQLGFQRPSQIK
jgi:hypothetical protein